MKKIYLQRFAKNKSITKSVNSSSSSQSSSSHSSSSSKTKEVSSSKSKTTGTTKTTGTSKTTGTTKTTGGAESTSKTTNYNNSTGGASSSTAGWSTGQNHTYNTTVKSNDTLAAEEAWKHLTQYKESDAVLDAYKKKKEAENAYAANGKYESSYQDKINEILDGILNNEKFSYDFNADPLYQEYKDQYMKNGKEAMMDTQAAAAALTGGYGSSYATQAGEQAYQQYLAGLNDKVPELYQLAMERYNAENEALYNQFNALGAQEDREYSHSQNDINNALQLMNYYQSGYNTEKAADIDKWGSELGAAQALAQYLYNQDYSTTTDTSSKNGSNTTETNWNKSSGGSTTNTKEKNWNNSKTSSTTNTKETAKTNQTQKTTGSSTAATKGSESSSSSSHSSSTSSSTSDTTSQSTLLRDIDADELTAVKQYADNGDMAKAANYIASMVKSDKYSDKQIAAVLQMAGLKKSDIIKKK